MRGRRPWNDEKTDVLHAEEVIPEMKKLMMPLLFVALLAVSIAVYMYLVPDLVRRGGPLVARSGFPASATPLDR